MKYNSLREYFYKLHSLLYALILLPLLAFIVLYWQMEAGNLAGPFKQNDALHPILLSVLGFIAASDWAVSFFLFSRRLKFLRTLNSLGSKLDGYFVLTFIRSALIVSGSLVLAGGFYLTENQVFTMLFVANFVLQLLFWPLPSRVCNDLHLKGDERTLVLYKKDQL